MAANPKTAGELGGTPAVPSKRLSLSTIVELLLTRGQYDRSTVELVRNARGDTQIAVKVGTGEGIETVEAACAVASGVYDQLRDRYPLADRKADKAEAVPKGRG